MVGWAQSTLMWLTGLKAATNQLSKQQLRYVSQTRHWMLLARVKRMSDAHSVPPSEDGSFSNSALGNMLENMATAGSENSKIRGYLLIVFRVSNRFS